MDYLLASEVTLPRLIWNVLRKRPTCVLEARSILQGHEGFIGRIVQKLRASGKLTTPADHPELSPYRDYGDFLRLTNAFAETEEWIEHRLDFAGSDTRFGRYAIAFRHLACEAMFQRLMRAHLLNVVRGRGAVIGLDRLDRALLRERFALDLPDPGRGERRILARLIALLALAKTALWILRRLRVVLPPAKSVMMASDYVGGERDLLVWQEITEDPSQIQVVFRDSDTMARWGKTVAHLRSCRQSDGLFPLGAGLHALTEAFRDGLRLHAAGRDLPVDILRGLLALPWKRMVYRALFQRFRPDFYWGRDDYNPDHAMRSQELRAVGGKSLGIMHGLPSIIPFSHQMRHLDFDLYYMHSASQYESYYRRWWPISMRVRGIGSVGLDRSDLRRLAAPVPRDFAFILGPSFHEDNVFALIRATAARFPDRTVWIATKSSYRDRGSFGVHYHALLADGPSNIREHEGSSYGLFFKARYWLSESSTMIAEAVQFGRYGFCFDPDPRLKFLYYRNFPGLLVRDPAEFVARIEGIESGRWVYPRTDFAALTMLDGRICWDEIRGDLGLARKEPAGRLAHLDFLTELNAGMVAE